MSLVALTPHLVCFRGPALDRMGRAALSAAAVSVVERHPEPGWAGQRVEFIVSVDARDSEHAIRRVRGALVTHGSYSGFGAERR